MRERYLAHRYLNRSHLDAQATPLSVIDGVSRSTQSAIRRIERSSPYLGERTPADRIGPGMTQQALRSWRSLSRATQAQTINRFLGHREQQGPTPELCREILQTVMDLLPRHQRRELRRIVSPMDEAIHARLVVAPSDDGWWRIWSWPTWRLEGPDWTAAV